MFYCKIINILIVCLIGAVAGLREISKSLICCSPEAGTYQSDQICWNEDLNKTSPLPLSCSESLQIAVAEDQFNYTVSDSGQVFFIGPQLDTPAELKRGDGCFANDTDAETDEVIKVIVLCAEVNDDHHQSVLGSCMLVSAIFLFLTTLVYVVLPEVRDLQGKSIINFCGSMCIGLAILSGMKLTTYTDMILCAIRGFMVYFFVMASFFWTNAISIQILLSLRRPVVNNYAWKEFLWYALYAWGCPVVMTMCMAIVNYHPGEHKKPGIGFMTCWFYNTTQQWYYMYSAMMILIVVNTCIFIYTSIHLWRLSFSSSNVKALRYKFVMSLRMFIIMGITWIFEMISSLTEKSTVWFIMDVFNALQGPLIFIVVVIFRKRVLKALLKRGYLSCVSGPVERYLALKEDDEEGVIQHTVDVTMVERNGVGRNGI